MQKYKYEMITLNMELTRRCNMQCAFCARGQAQNIDMSHEVIDATLNQLNGVYINNLRLNGGEPLLGSEALDYIVDGIIKRNIALVSCTVFTNGTIRNDNVRKSLAKLADYLDSKKWEMTNPEFERKVISYYKTAKPKDRISLVISEDYHNNLNDKHKTIEYYNYFHPNIGIGLQNNLYNGDRSNKLILEGLAYENMKSIIGEKLGENMVIRRILDEFSFIEWYPDYESTEIKKIITKTVGISANGNLYAGCLMPYHKVDSYPICNVIKCNNIFAKIEQYCWEHPITKKMSDLREYYCALCAVKENGIIVPENDELLNGMISLIDCFEKYAIEYHHQFPNAAPWQIQLAAAIRLCHIMHIVKGDEAKTGMEFFVNQLLDPIFEADIRDMLMSDIGRHILVQRLDGLLIQQPIDFIIDSVIGGIGDIVSKISDFTENLIIPKDTETYAEKKKAESKERANSPQLKAIREKLLADQK